jgi:hypothetical protein
MSCSCALGDVFVLMGSQRLSTIDWWYLYCIHSGQKPTLA